MLSLQEKRTSTMFGPAVDGVPHIPRLALVCVVDGNTSTMFFRVCGRCARRIRWLPNLQQKKLARDGRYAARSMINFKWAMPDATYHSFCSFYHKMSNMAEFFMVE